MIRSLFTTRRLQLERLEQRVVMTGLPYGATHEDTGEFLLGDVVVNIVLMESSEQLSSTNDNSETWTPETIAVTKQRVEEGLRWWTDALAAITDKHQLEFHFNYTYADNPVATDYEPITRMSTDFQFWIYDFLNEVGYNNSGNFSTDIRAFNHAQRVAEDADWAFTIFVVNDENDADGQFASGGFSRAFAFAGGRFFVAPAGRPASTFAHETGHMFWARDEYFGGGTYTAFRGYYNTQNLNAADNPTPGFQQVPSIMETGDCESGGGLLCTAYEQHVSSPSSFEMVGWRDTDGDGIFDLLDVPHLLNGTGFFDAATGLYRFIGDSAVQALPNLNPSGLGNDITLNKIGRAEYRVDGGSWQTAETFGSPTATLDLSIPLPQDAQQIEIRTIDDPTGVSSPVFVGYVDRPTTTLEPGLQGRLWGDVNGNGQWDSGEAGLPGWEVSLVDQSGMPLELQQVVEPDDFPDGGTILNNAIPGIVLRATGAHAGSGAITTTASADATSGTRVFASLNGACGGTCSEWSPDRQLRIDFDEQVSSIRIDAIGRRAGSRARLEIFDAANQLIGRATTGDLGTGGQESLRLDRPTADIAYAVASGHAETTVLFDNLRIGPESLVVTDADGFYRFSSLASGEYIVRPNPVGSMQPTNPATGQQSVALGVGAAVGGVDFGFQVAESRWQNEEPLDVNNDGFVSPVDVLRIINDLNSVGARQLTSEETPPYLDVNGDLSVTSHDVLLIINYLNAASAQGEGPPALSENRPQIFEVDQFVAEGEFHSSSPRTKTAVASETARAQEATEESINAWWAAFAERQPEPSDLAQRPAGVTWQSISAAADSLLLPESLGSTEPLSQEVV